MNRKSPKTISLRRKYPHRQWITVGNTRAVLIALFVFLGFCFFSGGNSCEAYSFIVLTDIGNYAAPRYDDPKYFVGVLEAVERTGKGEFLVSTGDMGPPWNFHRRIREKFGNGYTWYPAVGNHDAENPRIMAYLREYNKHGLTLPNVMNKGPEGCTETMYSFDYQNVHFVIINEYFDGKSDVGAKGDIVEETFEWLAADLKNTKKKFRLAFGHEPAFPVQDMDSKRMRHRRDSLNQFPENRDRFWSLLEKEKVAAFFCGHTHNASAEKFGSVYQVDAGHATGMADKGAPSSFVKIHVSDEDIRFEIYRLDYDRLSYPLRRSGILQKEE